MLPSGAGVNCRQRVQLEVEIDQLIDVDRRIIVAFAQILWYVPRVDGGSRMEQQHNC